MQIKWKRLIVKTTIWLAAEVYLNFLGLDNLADYDEFINLSFAVRHGSLVWAIAHRESNSLAPSFLDNTYQENKNNGYSQSIGQF